MWKCFELQRYLKLDEDLVREIVGIGIGEKKRSIIKTMKTPSPRAQVLMDAIKVMFEYIDRVDPSKSLLTSLIKRFHIKEELAKSYLSLLFLLLDTKEKDTVKNRPYMEWDIINVGNYYYNLYNSYDDDDWNMMDRMCFGLSFLTGQKRWSNPLCWRRRSIFNPN